MTSSGTFPYQRYVRWKTWVEAGLWSLLILANFIGNSLTTLIELRRVDSGFPGWEPVVWEASSATVWLLLLIPGIAWFTARFPLYWHLWRSRLAVYAGASVVLCAVHVLAMVGLREIAYAAMGRDYDFGPLPRELLYEYLKDVRSFAGIVVLMEGYRFLVRRWQGEASLLGRADDEPEPPASAPPERPERFLVRKLGREFLVATGEVEYLQASGNYVNLHLRGRDYPLRSTLARIGGQLDPRGFARIHRSYIVALAQVVSIEPLDSGDARVHLKDGTVLPCSRRYRQALRGQIDGEGA